MTVKPTEYYSFWHFKLFGKANFVFPTKLGCSTRMEGFVCHHQKGQGMGQVICRTILTVKNVNTRNLNKKTFTLLAIQFLLQHWYGTVASDIANCRLKGTILAAKKEKCLQSF